MVRGGIPNVLEKLEQGEAVRIVYLGGSITNANDGWRPQSLEWFQEQYPNAKLEGINAAISGTGSDLAAFRLKQDVLTYEPDLLFVEFAVNDGWTSDGRIQRAMEGLVRQTWRARPDCDIIFVYTIYNGMLKDLQAGELPHTVKSHEIVAENYGIPSVLFGVEVARLEKEGKLIFTANWPQTEAEKAALEGTILFSADGAHPYAQGHALYVQALARSIVKMKDVGRYGPHALPQPLFADNFEHVTLTPASKAHLSAGWRKLDPAKDPVAKEFSKELPEVWMAEKPGETITVRFRGTSLMVFDAVGPDCGQIIVTVDDGRPRIVPRFDSWCEWHRVYCFTAAADLPEGLHTVKMEIDSRQPDKVALLAERGVTMDDPKRYDGTRWYVGSILITGRIAD
jgi:lysophospholipase L1-like esterase